MMHQSQSAEPRCGSGPIGTVRDVGAMMREFRSRTRALVADLDEQQLIGPRLPTVNPPLWEIGHIGWFQEFWVLRHVRKHKPLLDEGDRLYNSTDIAHDTRWELLLPSRNDTWRYLDEVLDRVLETLDGRDNLPEEQLYFYLLTAFHEAMHAEALACTRQTLGYPAPPFLTQPPDLQDSESLDTQDVDIPGGKFVIGAGPQTPFVFDNEKWAHEVHLESFRIARAPVTNAQYRRFVEDGGYRRQSLWSEDGWRWLAAGGAPQLEKSFAKFFNRSPHNPYETTRSEQTLDHPVYWRGDAHGSWQQRVFDRYVPLKDNLPVVHVSWYEAQAYCRWAGRRLPSEAEWEATAAAEPSAGTLGARRRLFPWGEAAPDAVHANLDWRCGGVVDVGAFAAGDSAAGCRQMIGNVWEWTADDFAPYPGFVADPYKEYSQPWFGTHKVLRGGSWATSARLIRNTWRNFYTPDRRDIWAGFRTCAK